MAESELTRALEDLRGNRIRKLNLSKKRLATEDVRRLAEALKANSSLQRLDLSYNSAGDEGARALTEALKVNSSLQNLNLQNNRVGNVGARALAEALKVNTGLQSLDLVGNSVGEAGARALAEALKANSGLQGLFLGSNRVGDAGARELAEALKVNSSLQYLELTFNSVGEAGARALAEALKVNSSLQSLGLRNNSVGDAGASALAEALKANSSLQSLDLLIVPLGNQGIQALADALEENVTLDVLSVDKGANPSGQYTAAYRRITQYCEHNEVVRPFFLKSLAGAPAEVDLSGLPLGDGGTVAVARVLQTQPGMQQLRLQAVGMGDRGAQALADCLRGNTSLRELSLMYNNIGRQGATALVEALVGSQALMELQLENCGSGGVELAARLGPLLQRNRRYAPLFAQDGGRKVAPCSARVFLCGHPHAGKTQLCTSILKGNEVGGAHPLWLLFLSICNQEPLLRTRGIELSSVALGGVGSEKKATLWDLAGQAEYRVLHDLFLPDTSAFGSKVTVLVLVLDARKPWSMLEVELGFWLAFIGSNTGSAGRPKQVVTVLTHRDMAGSDGEQKKLLVEGWHKEHVSNKLQYGEVFLVDATKWEEARSVWNALEAVALQELANAPDVPAICDSLQVAVEALRSRSPPSAPVMSLGEFCEQLPRVPSEDLVHRAVEYLHDVGEVVLLKSDGVIEADKNDRKGVASSDSSWDDALVVVDPQWFCRDVVGEVLLPEGLDGKPRLMGEKPVNGKIPREVLLQVMRSCCQQLQLDLAPERLLKALEQLELCHSLPGTSSDPGARPKSQVLIPALLTELHPPTLEDLGLAGGSFKCVGRRMACKYPDIITSSIFPRLQLRLTVRHGHAGFGLGRGWVRLEMGQMKVLVQVGQNAPMDPQTSSDLYPWEFIDIIAFSRTLDPSTMLAELNRMEPTAKLPHPEVGPLAVLRALCAAPSGCPHVTLAEQALRPGCLRHGCDSHERQSCDVKVVEQELKRALCQLPLSLSSLSLWADGHDLHGTEADSVSILDLLSDAECLAVWPKRLEQADAEASMGERRARVFLSHRGPDTKRGFASDLRKDLHGAGMDAFLDKEDLRMGDHADERMMGELREADFVVVIISLHFFESPWCVDELHEAVERGRAYPVFYDVEPSEIEDLAALGTGRLNSEQLKSVRQLGRVTGLCLSKYNAELELRKAVVEHLMKKWAEMQTLRVPEESSEQRKLQEIQDLRTGAHPST